MEFHKEYILSYFVNEIKRIIKSNNQEAMNTSPNPAHIDSLKKKIEEQIRVPHTPSDFIYISRCIFDKTRENISSTTLMRVWGYVKEQSQTRITTLNILSRLIGYCDYQSFVESLVTEAEPESEPILAECIFSSKIEKGQKIEFTWNPDRRCVVQYLDENKFEVKLVENSKLEVGDHFTCPHFILNEPLYIFDLQSKDELIKTYEIGRKKGLTSLKLL